MHSRHHPERGFTLIEVLIVTVMVGLVATVLAAAIVVILRTTPGSTVRADDSRSYQGIVTWLPQDVASSADDGSGLDDFPTALLCTGITSSPGDIDLLQITWEEDTGAISNYVSIYRYEAVGNSKFAVRRYTCRAGGPAAELNLTSPLSNTAPGVVVDTSGDHATVRFTFTTADDTPFISGAENLVIEAATHNPDNTLPTTTLPATPPVLTICDASFTTGPYGPVGRKTAPPPQVNELAAAVSVTIEVTGDTCGAMLLAYNTGFTAKTHSITATGTPGTYVIIIPEGSNGPTTPKWTAATHTLTITDDGSPVGATSTLQVLP